MSQPLINITRKHALIFAAFLVLYEFLTYLANDMIMPGMVKVVESFHGEEAAIATSLTAYVLGGASLQLFLGPISDRYGRRPVMIFGALLFFFCTVLIACANSMDHFLIARFFQGMGLCFIAVIGYATLQEIFEEMDAVRLVAIMANISILAPLIGPLLGAAVIYYYHWRMIFVIIGVFSLLALWGLWRFMPESVGQIKRDGEKITQSSLSPAVILRNYGKLLANPAFMAGSIAIGLISTPCLVWIALSPVILITDAKLSVIQYALWQIPLFGATILGNWVLQRLTHYKSLKKIIMMGTAFTVVSLLIMFFFSFVMNNHFIWLMPGLTAYFFCIGMTIAPLNRFILFSTPVAKGTASALMSMLSMCIQALGIEIANVLYTSHSNVSLGFYCALIGLLYFIVILGVIYKSTATNFLRNEKNT